VHGAGIDEILVQTQGSTDAFYHHDALGSTVLLTNASGNIVRSYEYDVFGQVSNPPSVDDMFSADPYANRFLYTGREFLKEANLYDYRNRVYSAELGRFLQTDPIRFEAGDGNLYRYVFNRASLFIDPLGLACGSGFLQDLIVPDKIPSGANFGPACSKHDSCYDTCNASKKYCDDAFLADMYAICERLTSDKIRLCRIDAVFYYKAVRYLGCGPYKKAQIRAGNKSPVCD
jgi:RHS repeat-associated protein